MNGLAIRVRVLYFGQAREAAGRAEEEFSLPGGSSVALLAGRAVKAHSRLRGMPRAMRFAVNEEIATDGRTLSDGDVVAFLPPVAGG